MNKRNPAAFASEAAERQSAGALFYIMESVEPNLLDNSNGRRLGWRSYLQSTITCGLFKEFSLQSRRSDAQAASTETRKIIFRTV